MTAFKAGSWRTVLIASAIAVFAGPLMMALGDGAVKAAGEITALASIFGVSGSFLASTLVSDEGPRDIVDGINAAHDAKKQIKEIKNKINEIKKKPVMGKR